MATTGAKQHGLSGKEKAAALLVALGPELSSKVFRHLSDDEIEQITLQIASLRNVQPEVREKVIDEFHELSVAKDYLAHGGLDYAKDLLERALGTQKAMEILDRLTATLQVRPFEFVRQTDPSQVLGFMQNEHPQTIALILAYLQPEQAAVILQSLPTSLQAEVAKRLATMDRTAPEIIQQVEKVLERKLSSLWSQEYTAAGGIEAAVAVLNRVDRSTEKSIMENLEQEEPELAEEIKKRMFVFEDIVILDNRSLQRVLRDVDLGKDLPLALKVASDEVKEKIFQNISKHAGETLRENMDFLGPVRLRDVEEAQQRIVNTIRRLEEAGEIVISRGGEDEIIV